MSLIWLFLAVFASAVLACTVITPIVRAAALRYGLVDVPDGRRKMHIRPIPVAGGVAVLAASVLVFSGLFIFQDSISAILKHDEARSGFGAVVAVRPELIGLAIAAAILGVVGVLDDLIGLAGKQKLMGQIAAVTVVITSGVSIRSLTIFGYTWDLGPLSIVITSFWLLGAINSLNLIDGLDGLLGSVGCIVCGTFAALSYMNGQWQAAFLATAVAGSLLGFLFFNFPPASIFLGDCGSMLVGLVVGVLGIESSLKGAAAVSLAAPLAILIVPIFDTSAAIVRRKLTGRSIYATDRGHLHHRLMDSGMSNRQVLLLVGTLCLLAAGGALASQALKNQMVALFAVLVIISLLVVTRLFGHAEFLLVKERVLDFMSGLRRTPTTGRVHQHSVRLQGSADWDEMWRNVTAAAEQMQFKTVCLDVNAPQLKEGYHARWGRVQSDLETPCYWRTEVPLTANGQIIGRLEVVGQRNGEPLQDTMGRVSRLVEELELAMASLTAFAVTPSLNRKLAERPRDAEPAQSA